MHFSLLSEKKAHPSVMNDEEVRFPKSTDDITNESWDRHRPYSSTSNVVPTDVRVIMKMVDDLIRQRIFEAFERVGAEGWRRARRQLVQEYVDEHRRRDSSESE